MDALFWLAVAILHFGLGAAVWPLVHRIVIAAEGGRL